MAAQLYISSPPKDTHSPKWPKSIKQSISDDQAAIEQARRELGPDADAKKILSRAQEIKKQKGPNSLIWRIAVKS